MLYRVGVFIWRERLPTEVGVWGVDWGFTDAHGGVSQGDWTALNLGAHVGDDPAHVEQNRQRLADGMELPREHLAFMNQRQGTRVETITGPWPGPAPEADAVATSRADLALVVLVADCAPVLLADRRRGLAAAVHAGRPGMIGGVVPHAVRRLRELGAEDLQAMIGPSVCPRCYEVPAGMRDAAAQVSPASAAVSWTGTPAIDVAAGVASQLHDLDVPFGWVPGCTRESADLYSHRGSARTGRSAGVVRLRAPAGP